MKHSLIGTVFFAAFLLLMGGCAPQTDVPSSADDTDIAPPVAEEEGSGSGEWPATLPAAVPQFTGAEITDGGAVTIAGNTMWSVSFGQTNKEQVLAYIRGLQSAGWESTEEEIIAQVMDMSQWEEDAQEKSLFFEKSDEGILIVLSLEKDFSAVRIDVANDGGTEE